MYSEEENKDKKAEITDLANISVEAGSHLAGLWDQWE